MTEWRYLWGGTVKHALVSDPMDSLCGLRTASYNWYGTGSQAEYETVEALRPCRRCLARLGRMS